MPFVLIVEKSPLIATDISEVCAQTLSQHDTIVAGSVEAARRLLAGGAQIEACIVSGMSAPSERQALGAILRDAEVPIVVISEDQQETSKAFGQGAARINRPFTTEMLSRALTSLSLDARPSPAPR